MKASDLILQPKCYMEISVIRSGRAPKLNTSIALINGSNENENCYQMFQKIPKNKNCITYERQCYTDIEDELFYCCRFQQKNTTNDKILTIHSVFGDFVFDELKVCLFLVLLNLWTNF